jgi:hypothetical protein
METNPKYSYSNSGHTDSFEVGNFFQDFVCIELAKQNIIMQNINSKKFQFDTGENLQGFEIKYDARCTGADKTIATNRLSIEIAEKSKAENAEYVKSGIYRNDNSWLYIQGNTMCFWIFSKSLLINLHKMGKYEEFTQPTIKTFFLPIIDADKYCCRKFNF